MYRSVSHPFKVADTIKDGDLLGKEGFFYGKVGIQNQMCSGRI